MQPLAPAASASALREAGDAPSARADGAARAAGRAPPAAVAREPAPPQRALHAARRDWQPQLGRQTAGAQQALVYLERLGAQLQALKASLSARLAGNLPAGATSLDSLVQSTEALWQRRAVETGGSLDSQLHYGGEPGAARRGFRIRGLDAAALRSGDRETLAFSLADGGQPVPAVTLEAGATLAANLRRIDRALAPAGIRAGPDADGEPLFSVLETAWPAVRDGLAVKGGGVRFAAGQSHRVKAEAQPDALAPARWRGEDAAALRRSLHEVTQALERIRRVTEAVRQALDRAAPPAGAAAAADPAWAAGFAADFGARAQSPDYEVYAAVAPALASVDRSRVLSLLALN